MGSNAAKCGKCGQVLRERAGNRGKWCPCVTKHACESMRLHKAVKYILRQLPPVDARPLYVRALESRGQTFSVGIEGARGDLIPVQPPKPTSNSDVRYRLSRRHHATA